MWRKGNPCALLVGMQVGTATVENSMEVPQKIKNRPYDPAIPLLDIYPKKMKTLIHVYCSITYNSQDMEAT